jgi:hypothetical protein
VNVSIASSPGQPSPFAHRLCGTTTPTGKTRWRLWFVNGSFGEVLLPEGRTPAVGDVVAVLGDQQLIVGGVL